jgi:hypothetical protein
MSAFFRFARRDAALVKNLANSKLSTRGPKRTCPTDLLGAVCTPTGSTVVHRSQSGFTASIAATRFARACSNRERVLAEIARAKVRAVPLYKRIARRSRIASKLVITVFCNPSSSKLQRKFMRVTMVFNKVRLLTVLLDHRHHSYQSSSRSASKPLDRHLPILRPWDAGRFPTAWRRPSEWREYPWG